MASIVVVDDSNTYRRLLRRLLEPAGYLVREAADGVQAVDLLRVQPQPVVVLLDHRLPKLDGWQVLDLASRTGSPLAAHAYVFMTGDEAALERAAAAPPRGLRVDLLPKPFDAGLLLRTVRDAALRLVGTAHPGDGRPIAGPRDPSGAAGSAPRTAACRAGGRGCATPTVCAVRVVLVVDDDVDIRRLLRFALEREGYGVLEAGDGRSALALLRQAARPLVVLLDYRMPAMDGMELLEAVAADPASARRHGFILLTADDQQLAPGHRALLARLAVPLLGKPFDLDVVLDAVGQADRRLP